MTGLYLLTAGDPADPLLLCLHGIGSSSDAFTDQLPLADRVPRRVVAWDAPGYGRSPDVSSSFALDDWADAAARIIIEHGAPADVLGVSWGGVTATRLALRRPDLVRSLTLADSSTGSGGDPDRAEAMRNRARDLEAVGHEAFCRSRAPRLVTPDAPVEFVERVAQTMMRSVRVAGYDRACHSMAETDHTNRLAEIEAPTLVVVGADDVVTPPARAEVLANGIPHAHLVTIAAAGHLANQEQPDEFNRVVADFLSRER